jgi:thiol-disulfide isomerase/thioredoxin
MSKIKAYFTNYFKKSSRFKIITDFIFYLFIVLMIIPGTRRPLSELIIKATMIRPKVKSENIEALDFEDNNNIIQDLKGNIHNIGDFKGNVILINFWATWCPPCRAEMPAFQKLYNDYSDKMIFLFITDDPVEKVEKFMTEFKYQIPIYFQRSVPTQIFNIHSYPTTFVINKKGGIVVNKKGAANWNSKDFREKLNSMIKDKLLFLDK